MSAASDLPRLLREQFGFDAFRPGQEQVVRTLLARRSSLAIFPTGAGKSLCYQLPALLLEGLTLVVSPLIALMKDQVDFLQRKGVAAARLDSSLEFADILRVQQDLQQGQLKILYIAPERLSNERFRPLLQRVPIALLAIDEAHCISEWGHNFRPEYLKLAQQAKELKVERVLALTATATPTVARDVAQAFGIASDDVVRTGFYRANLTLRVSPCRSPDRLRLLAERLRERPEGATIVYVTLQKTSEDVAAALSREGYSARHYHAGMEALDRALVQDWFMAAKAPIVVATIAFGMGIDKAAIRYVYHYNLPKSLESYAQEIGRAGRDGQPSICETLACPSDRTVLENFVYSDTPASESILALLDDLLSRGPAFDVSTYELSGLHDIRPLVLDTLLTYLELEGILEYAGSHYRAYKFQPLKSSKEILARFDAERAKFLGGIFRHARKLKTWFELDVDAAAAALQQPRGRVLTALNYLEQQGDIVLQVAEGRQAYRRTRPGWPAGRERVELNKRLVERFTRRETSDVERLGQVLNLVQSSGCLTGQLLSHFGEEARECGHCSWCLGERNLSFPPEDAAKLGSSEERLLQALVQEGHGALRLPRQLARFLCGLSSPAASRAKLGKHDSYGALTHLPFQRVLDWVQERVAAKKG